MTKNSKFVPISKDGIGTRLTALVAKLGGVPIVSGKMGLAGNTLRRWMSGEGMIRLDDAAVICAESDASLEWLATGTGPVSAAGSSESGLSVVPGAGGDAALAVPAGLLPGGRTGCSAHQVHGDAMLPSLPPGSTVVVDRNQTQLLDGQVYMLTLGGAATYRRAQAAPGGFRLVADNQKYESYTLDALGSDSIAGRVVLVLAAV